MKISKLIEKLEKFKQENGNVDLYQFYSDNNKAIKVKDIRLYSGPQFSVKGGAYFYFDKECEWNTY